MSKKNVDTIAMNTDTPVYAAEKPAVTATAEEKAPAAETFEKEGVKIYVKDESGNVTYYDANGKEVDSNTVDTLFAKYPAPLEFNQQGAEKKGEMETRESKYQKSGNEKFEDGKEPEYVVEKQEYTEGDVYTATIRKELYPLVKFLRGDYNEKEKESG